MKPNGTWVRSSSRAAFVLHPDGSPLPRARGLQTLQLQENGVARVVVPGRDDRRSAATGSWTTSEDGQVEVALEDSVRYFTLEADSDQARLVPEDERGA